MRRSFLYWTRPPEAAAGAIDQAGRIGFQTEEVAFLKRSTPIVVEGRILTHTRSIRVSGSGIRRRWRELPEFNSPPWECGTWLRIRRRILVSLREAAASFHRRHSALFNA